MAKIVILGPYGARTGGPEACFQLSDALLRQGFDAELWLVTPEDVEVLQNMAQSGRLLIQHALNLPERPNQFAEYEHYLSRSFQGGIQGPTVFVMPEVYAWLVPVFQGFQVLMWWLSVDNAFSALSKMNLNHLRLPGVRHACQSVYARQVVEALGMNCSMLSDHTSVPAGATLPIEQRPMKVCINAGNKVIFNLDLLRQSLRELMPEVEIVDIVGMSREDVYAHFSTARLFIDLGKFPGKDRMVREALLLGANGIIARAGAGANAYDYPFPAPFIWQIDRLERLAEQAVQVMREPQRYSAMLDPARHLIRQEKAIFDAEAAITMQPYLQAA